MKLERVYFYSKYDGACFGNLELADKRLNTFSAKNNYDSNDIIELYQVNLYIDSEPFSLNQNSNRL